jgi:hypothetical protein
MFLTGQHGTHRTYLQLLTMIIARILSVVENTSQDPSSSFVGPIADGTLEAERRPSRGLLSGSLLRFVGIADRWSKSEKYSRMRSFK